MPSFTYEFPYGGRKLPIFAENVVFGAVLIIAVAITIDRSKIPVIK